MWFSQEIYDEIKPQNDVYLGNAEQFVVHDDEDAVSLPEETEQPATSVEMESLDTEDQMHGKLMYFRTEDVDWPTGYEGAEVTLGLGIFEEELLL